jgi:transposase
MGQPGRPRTAPVFNSLEERQLLFDCSKNPPQQTQALALRCRIVTACADGYTNRYVARHFGVSEAMVSKWCRRYVERGPEGLFDQPRSGAPGSITDTQVERVLGATLEESPPGGRYWTSQAMADATDISATSVRRFWKKYGVHPRQGNIFQLSADPEFVGRVHGVVALYLHPPEGALVLGVDKDSPADEHAPVDASGPSTPVLPRRSEMAEGASDDHQHGPTDLHRALEVASGQVVTDQAIAKTTERDRDFRFRRFLQLIDLSVPGGTELHVVVDHSSTKMTDALARLLDDRPRFHLHPAPTWSWWMHLVEWWLTELAARGLDPSTTELAASINDWIENWTEDPSPFVWKQDGNQIGERLSP